MQIQRNISSVITDYGYVNTNIYLVSKNNPPKAKRNKNVFGMVISKVRETLWNSSKSLVIHNSKVKGNKMQESFSWSNILTSKTHYKLCQESPMVEIYLQQQQQSYVNIHFSRLIL